MLSYELREQVFRYVHEEISLVELEKWYVPRLSYFLESPDSDDAELIAAVELALAEVADGLIEEAEARAAIRVSLEHTETVAATPGQIAAAAFDGSPTREGES